MRNDPPNFPIFKHSMEEARRSFFQYLNEQVIKYLDVLEELFDPHDPRFVFGNIQQSDRNPHTSFPGNYHKNGGCVVDILVGKTAWKALNYAQSTWQVAHEFVHLLDRCLHGSANVLEEGLATSWFQDEPRFHDDRVKEYIALGNQHPRRDKYSTANRLVVQCMPEIIPAVKKFRLYGTAIRDIAPDVLVDHLPHADKETIEELCIKFNID